MVSVQFFIDVLHKYQMRFHFSHITRDGWYKPYTGKRVKFNVRGSMHEVILGYKSLHFDWWGSRVGWPCNSVGIYYPVRTRYGSICYEHKNLFLPDLLRTLKTKRFEKRMAIEARKEGLPLNSLGALFA